MIDLNALFKIQYGMYIVTSKYEEKINGQIATVVFQVTNNPVQLAICLSKNTYTYELALKSMVLGISVLSEEAQAKEIGIFGYKCGRECFKFSGVTYETGITGVPLVTDNVIVIMEVNVKQIVDVGTHVLFIGELSSSKKIRDGNALTYENYHIIRKGKTPENAPTFVA